jgi:hypothetical protein
MYPVSYEADYAEKRNRLTTFFRYFVAIPWQLVAYFYGLAGYIAAFIAWFAILFTGRYPQGLYDFVAGYLRMQTRTNAFGALLTDEYPAFGGDPDPNYPVRVDIAAPKPKYSRLKAFFRFIIGIPVMLLLLVWGIVAMVCIVLAWLAIVFTGKMPDGLFNPIRSAMAYSTRATAYFLYLTEDWPPFSFDEEASRTAIEQTRTPALETQPAATRQG